MSSYAVIWRDDDEPPLSGRLELTGGALSLHGGNRGNEKDLLIPYGEILGLERGSETRIGRCRAITIFRASTGELLIASVGGVGFLSEIFAALQQTLGG